MRKAEGKEWRNRKGRDGESEVVPCSRSNPGHGVAACVFCGKEKETAKVGFSFIRTPLSSCLWALTTPSMLGESAGKRYRVSHDSPPIFP